MNSILNNNKSMVLADQVVFSGTSFVTTVLMTRILSPSDFGIYASIILFIYFIISILTSINIQPLQVTLTKIDDTSSYISFSFWLQLALILLISLIIGLVLKLKLPYLEMYNELGFSVLILSAGFVMHDYFRKLLLAQAKIKHALIIDLVDAFIQLCVLFSALFIFNFTLSEVITILGLAYLPAFVLSIVIIRPWLRFKSNWKFFGVTHYHQSKWLLLTAVVQWWSGNLFVVASGVFLGIKALGAFRLIQTIFGVLNMLLQTFENYVLPQTSRLLFSSIAEAKRYLKQISLKSSILFGFVLILTFIFSKSIILLAGGEQYVEYAYVVKGMAILYFFIFLGYPVRMAIRALVLNKHFFIGYIFSLIFSLSSFNFLLNSWNLTGAIVGLIVSQIILLSYWQLILINKNFVLWK